MRRLVAALLLATAWSAVAAKERDGRVDLNTASFAELHALPGMGNEYVRRVIAGRPYSAKNQLVSRGILPQDEYGRIASLVVAHRPKTGS